ncbi:MAG: hypothetical protein U9Q37_06205 [Euryarchaeota archaeon]|nr:hypothetical protein [Euryarchaeota archaeon]
MLGHNYIASVAACKIIRAPGRCDDAIVADVRGWQRMGGCKVFCVLERDCACRCLKDHERVERGDAAVVVHVCIRVPAAGGCEMERDRGVGGGDLVVAVEVAFLRRGGPWMHDCVSKGVASEKR